MPRASTLMLLTLMWVGCDSAYAAPSSHWNLPVDVSDANCTVTFDVGTTWHTVHGVTKNLRGKVWLTDSNDPSSIKAEINLPVAQFDTDNSSRDSRLREIMSAGEFPDVALKISSIGDLCAEESVRSGHACSGVMQGSLDIRGTIRAIRLPYTLSFANQRFHVKGQIPFEWAAFGVEDPSIFIARVHKDVTIDYDLTL